MTGGVVRILSNCAQRTKRQYGFSEGEDEKKKKKKSLTSSDFYSPKHKTKKFPPPPKLKKMQGQCLSRGKQGIRNQNTELNFIQSAFETCLSCSCRCCKF